MERKKMDAPMSDAENNMACHSYGFGRWKAPYWFIGPEQGKGPNESADNKDRLDAWLNLGGKELFDCRRFHELIHDDTRHREKPHLQPTWRPLITLLMAFLGKSTDREDLAPINETCGAWRARVKPA
jgi:hypothetical protein